MWYVTASMNAENQFYVKYILSVLINKCSKVHELDSVTASPSEVGNVYKNLNDYEKSQV